MGPGSSLGDKLWSPLEKFTCTFALPPRGAVVLSNARWTFHLVRGRAFFSLFYLLSLCNPENTHTHNLYLNVAYTFIQYNYNNKEL